MSMFMSIDRKNTNKSVNLQLFIQKSRAKKNFAKNKSIKITFKR